MFEDGRRTIYLFSIQFISFLLTLLYSLSLDPSYLTAVLLVACQIVLIIRLRKGIASFLLIWQLQLFILAIIGVLLYPNYFLNDNIVSSSEQEAFALVLIISEVAILLAYHFKERGIIWILKGSTISLIIVVLLVIGLVGSQGLAGMMQSGPIAMLTTAKYDPYALSNSTSGIDLTTIVDPYDYSISFPQSTVHMAPESERILNFQINNMGALNDSYNILVTNDPGINVTLPSGMMNISAGSSGMSNLTIASTEAGNYTINFEVSDLGKIIKERSLLAVVGTHGFDISVKDTSVYLRSNGYNAFNIPFEIENTGTVNDSTILEVEAPSDLHYIPRQFRDGIILMTVRT